MMGVKEAPKTVDQFVEHLSKGCVPHLLPKAKNVWRVSALVQMWKLKCPKLLYLYLSTGEDKEFDNSTHQTFALGTKVHDLVKEYFHDSPHFKVVHEELPIRHSYLPLTGTMDLVVEWDKYPGEEFIVEIKSCATEFVNNPVYGSRRKPFNSNRWQAQIYSRIYSEMRGKRVKPIILYYDKNNGEMIPHILEDEDKDVDEIFEALENVSSKYNAEKRAKEEGETFLALPVLNGVCKTKPHRDCHLWKYCDLFTEEGKRI